MKRAEALDEPELAQLLLQLVPQAQQDQYLLIKGTIPVNLCATLDTLKTIEKLDIQVPSKTEKSMESGNRNGKRKCSPKNDGLPRNRKNSSKYCALCAKHGGSKTTHNNGDCKKYEKHGIFKKTFKSQKGKSSVNKRINHQSVKTLEEDLKKVRTKLKIIKKGYCKSKKHKRDDLSESSNSSEALGWIVCGN
jgi:hypothetical protein